MVLFKENKVVLFKGATGLMSRLYLTVLTIKNETYFSENGFPSFESQIFLPTNLSGLYILFNYITRDHDNTKIRLFKLSIQYVWLSNLLV